VRQLDNDSSRDQRGHQFRDRFDVAASTAQRTSGSVVIRGGLDAVSGTHPFRLTLTPRRAVALLPRGVARQRPCAVDAMASLSGRVAVRVSAATRLDQLGTSQRVQHHPVNDDPAGKAVAGSLALSCPPFGRRSDETRRRPVFGL
jgi:hypothetical protein